MKSRIKIISALVIIFALGGWLMGLSSFVTDMSTMTAPKSTDKLDAIVVLTGGSNRLDVGFNLLEQGFGHKLFISGVGGHGLDVKKLLKRWKAEPQRKLDCCVELGFDADNTTGNAMETAMWLHKEGFHSIYLVTANYHIRRALLEFSRLAPDVVITPYAVIPDRYDNLLIMREYTKYILAYIRSLL